MKYLLILMAFISQIGYACVTPDTSVSKVTFPQKMTVQEKKQHFKDTVLPSIQEVYQELNCEYGKLEMAIANNATNSEFYDNLKKKYKVNTDDELLVALKPHPISVALSQAAIESDWATSRFTTEANNIFGVWSFNKNEPRIAAGSKRGSKTIWLKKYATIKESIRDYYLNLSRNMNYKAFRQYRLDTDNPHKIVTGLDKYSEKGAEYGKLLSSIIRFNKFEQYDVK